MQGKIKKISVSQGNEDSDGQEITVRDQGIGGSSMLSKRSDDISPLNSQEKDIDLHN